MQFEVELHKQRNKELQAHCDFLERKIGHYLEQQSLFKIMRDDLETYKRVAIISKEMATYYSPFTPLEQFKREKVLEIPQMKDEIIDIKEAIKESAVSSDQFKREIDRLRSQNQALSEYKANAEIEIENLKKEVKETDIGSKLNLQKYKEA